MQAAAMPMGKVVVRCDHATCTVHTPEVLASFRPGATSQDSLSRLEFNHSRLKEPESKRPLPDLEQIHSTLYTSNVLFVIVSDRS